GGDGSVDCPRCNAATESAATPAHAPVGGETVYGLTKVDQERLVLLWGEQVGIPTVALGYSCTYGPRQSVFNPYTGVIAIFCSRLVNGLAPILYEDGEQTRDLCYVGDVARACLLAAESDRLDGLAVNIGTGRPTSVRRLAEALSDLLGVRTGVEIPGAYRPGEMRALTPDIGLAAKAGFQPRVNLEEGLAIYADWLHDQGPIEETF